MKLSLSKRKGTRRISKSAKFVLFVGDEGAILVHMQADKVLKRLFAPNPEPANTRLFTELLNSAPKVPIYMLIDMMDQSYVRHDLPPVSSMSVGKLIRRRLERDFSAEDIKGSLSLGRDAGGRKDWNYLLIALAATNLFSQWLNLLLDAPNPFQGIYLVPVETQKFLANLRQGEPETEKTSQWQILVSHNKVGGFRQVVLKNERLIFTRLTQPVGETVPEVIAGNIEQEVLNTIEYIKRLSYQEQAGLDLYIIVSQEIKNVIDASKFKVSRTEIYTPHEAATKLKIEQAALPGDHFGDVLLAASFGTSRKHVLRLATPLTQKISMLNNARMGLRLAGGIAIAATLLFGAVSAFEIFTAASETSQLANDQKVAALNLAKVKEEAKALPVDIDKLNVLMDFYNSFSKEDRVPFELITKLAPVLGNGIQTKSFKWRVQENKSSAPSTPANTPGTYPVSVEMAIEFTKNTGDIDLFIKTANEFLDRLHAAFPDYDIASSKLPGTTAESESLKLSFDTNTSLNNDVFVAGQPIVVQVTMNGPKPKPGGIKQ